MLVAPVLARLRLARRLEVEVRSSARRARGAGEDDAQDVAVLVLVDEIPEREQLRDRVRRVPLAHVRARRAALRRQRVEARAHVAQLHAERVDVVPRSLDADQQAVERGELDAGRVEPRLERLHERRPEPANGSSTCAPRVK